MKGAKLLDSNYKRVVLITGCGSGLGRALAKRLYQEKKFRLVATTRSKESAQLLKTELPENEDFYIVPLDVTNQKEREDLVASIYHNWRSIDILINNAGVSYRSVIEHMDDESELHQLEVNYLGPMALIRLVIPGMREKCSGQIINISSVSGMLAASKHALEGATEALWYELRPYGIRITLVQPGFIRSNSFEKVYFSKKAELSKGVEGPYSEYYLHMGQFVDNLMLKSFSTPETISDKIIQLIEKKSPPLWYSATLDASLFFWLRKILPRRVFHKIMFAMLPQVSHWGERQMEIKKLNSSA
jgi:short-subunit dehydrogenase